MNDFVDQVALCVPRINLNGTSGEQLLEQYVAALDTLRAATSALRAISPHGRDWQTNVTPNAFRIASSRHTLRMLMMEDLQKEIEEIAVGISKQIDQRKS
jgi:hypothetical protein